MWEAKGICYLFGIILSCKNCIISMILFQSLRSPVFFFFFYSVAKSHLKKGIIYYWQWLEKRAWCRKVHCFMHLPHTVSISLKYASSNYDRCDSYSFSFCKSYPFFLILSLVASLILNLKCPWIPRFFRLGHTNKKKDAQGFSWLIAHKILLPSILLFMVLLSWQNCVDVYGRLCRCCPLLVCVLI